MIPELHLTRWLRCILAREFSVENCLILWDFIFCGIYIDISTRDNPFSNLDFLCVAMMLSIQRDLLENEDSAVLGILMSFKEPE